MVLDDRPNTIQCITKKPTRLHHQSLRFSAWWQSTWRDEKNKYLVRPKPRTLYELTHSTYGSLLNFIADPVYIISFKSLTVLRISECRVPLPWQNSSPDGCSLLFTIEKYSCAWVMVNGTCPFGRWLWCGCWCWYWCFCTSDLLIR